MSPGFLPANVRVGWVFSKVPAPCPAWLLPGEASWQTGAGTVSAGVGRRQPHVPLQSYSSHDWHDFGGERLFSTILLQSDCSPAMHYTIFPMKAPKE